jgi:hypothetical protein
MRGFRFGTALAAALAAGIAAAPAQAPRTDPAVQQGMDALMKALGGAPSTGGAPGLVDFRALKELLPAGVPGFQRKSASGEKSGAMGMSVSAAEASYEKAGGGRLTLKITDLGGLGGIAAMSHAAWASAEIDRETDTGYEKTLVHKGFKAMRRYDRGAKGGQMQVFVASRFMVDVEGDGVEDADIEALVGRVDVGKLSTLRPAPAAAKP